MVLKTSAGAPITCSDWDDLCDEDGFLALGRSRYPFNYVIYTDGTNFYAENGVTGNLDYGGPNNRGGVSGIDADAVIQAALDATSTGGTFYFKTGTYPLSTSLEYYTRQKFYGNGIDRTKFDVNGDFPAFTPSAVPTYYTVFQDFILHLNTTTTSNCALDLTKANYSEVKRIATWSRDAADLWDVGILIDAVEVAGPAYYNLIHHCNIARFDSTGVHCTGVANGAANLNWIKHCKIGSGAHTNATSVLFDYAHYGLVFHCDVGGANVDYGVYVDHADHTTIDGNFFEGIDTTCIHITANANNTGVYNNPLNLVGPTLVTNLGTDTKFMNNRGYVTENRGTATIVAAGTSIVAAHGCNYTPNASDIDVVLTNQPTNDIGDVWVDTIGAANFTINCRNVPGVATAIFAWSVNRVQA